VGHTSVVVGHRHLRIDPYRIGIVLHRLLILSLLVMDHPSVVVSQGILRVDLDALSIHILRLVIVTDSALGQSPVDIGLLALGVRLDLFGEIINGRSVVAFAVVAYAFAVVLRLGSEQRLHVPL
jgi:hypothetical protein